LKLALSHFKPRIVPYRNAITARAITRVFTTLHMVITKAATPGRNNQIIKLEMTEII
jgi:hypothetical protein